MKKRVLAGLVTALLLVFACGLTSCSRWDEDVKVVLNNRGNIEKTYTVSIFKNAVLADIKTEKVIGKTTVEEDGRQVEKDVEFLGWDPDPSAAVGVYKAHGLLRIAEMQDYVRNGVLVMYAIYGVKPVEKHDLVIAWYGQAVAGLTDAIMEKYVDALLVFLDANGFEDLDIVVRKYIGDVAASCAEVKADGYADIMLGWGGNLGSVGGIVIEDFPDMERQSGIAMGNKTGRYVDLIRNTKMMFEGELSLSKKVWQWTVENAALLV